jgi:hypothetical protein
LGSIVQNPSHSLPSSSSSSSSTIALPYATLTETFLFEIVAFLSWLVKEQNEGTRMLVCRIVGKLVTHPILEGPTQTFTTGFSFAFIILVYLLLSC